MPQVILGSWKEIAQFFGKSVRTVQRWEEELGLPVHRPDRNKSTVLADPNELKSWTLGAASVTPRMLPHSACQGCIYTFSEPTSDQQRERQVALRPVCETGGFWESAIPRKGIA
jgi:hypothetical protein